MTRNTTDSEAAAQLKPANQIYQWRLDAHRNGYVVVPDNRDNHGCAGWSTMEIDEELIATWPAFNTGIRCNGLAAVDSDVDDPKLAKKVDALRLKILGKTPLERFSRSPRKLSLYRREDAMRSIKTDKYGGHEVEIFCDRDKFTAHGIHPKSGRRYRWSKGGSPATVPKIELLVVTAAQLNEFKAAIIRIFASAGLERERGKTNSATAPNGASDHEGTFDDLELANVIPMQNEGRITVRELLEKYGETGLENARCCCSPWRENADAPSTGQVTIDTHTRGRIKIFDHKAKVLHMLSDAALKEWNDALAGQLAAAMPAEKLPEQHRKTLAAVKGLEGGNPIISGAAFVRDYVPPAYVVRGILQQRYLNSLTGQPGSGKTAVASLLAVAVALGRSELAGVDVYQGKVLYLAGENPDDTRMRLIALCHQHDIDPEQLQGKLDIFPGATRMTEEAARQVILWAGETGPYVLVVVDTVAAYFAGDDEDKNKDAGDHARRLRGLTGIDGGPAILALAHPAKAARKPWEMVPRGGSAFLAEIDGNIYIVQEKGISTVGPTPKFRGARFESITFDLVQINDNPVLIDDKGNQISSVIAAPVSADALEDRREQAMRNEDRLLLALATLPPDASLADLAVEVGWYYKEKGKSVPNKPRVRRTLKRMTDSVEVIDGRYVFTPKGKRLLAELRKAVDQLGRGE